MAGESGEGAAEEKVSFATEAPGEGEAEKRTPGEPEADRSEPEAGEQESAEAAEPSEAERLLFSDEEEEGEEEEIPEGDSIPRTTFLARVQKLSQQRDAARVSLSDARSQIDDLRSEIEELQQAADGESLASLYEGFENPYRQAQTDKLLMDFLERKKGHPLVEPVWKALGQFLETGKEPTLETTQQPTRPTAPARESGHGPTPAEERLIRREAVAELRAELLPALDESYHTLITNHVRNHWDASVEPTKEAVAKVVREFMAENGLTKTAAKKAAGGAKPGISGRRGGSAVAQQQGTKAAKPEGEKSKAKTAEEAEKSRRTRFQGLVDESIGGAAAS